MRLAVSLTDGSGMGLDKDQGTADLRVANVNNTVWHFITTLSNSELFYGWFEIGNYPALIVAEQKYHHYLVEGGEVQRTMWNNVVSENWVTFWKLHNLVKERVRDCEEEFMQIKVEVDKKHTI